MILTLDGKRFEISPQFGAAVQNALGTLTFDTAKTNAQRLAIMHMSNERQLSDEERTRVDYLTHVLNVASAIRVVGAHHDPVKEWGFDGWDAVHGNARLRPCGCEEHHVFDHHSALNHFGHNRVTETIVHHPIEPRRVCKAHEHLRSDPHALQKALEGDGH